MSTTADRPRFLFGLLLIVIGALYLLSNIGILRGFNPWAVLWGAFWLWLGAAIVGPRGRGVGATRLAFSLLLIFIGVVTLLEGIGAIGFTFGDLMANFWPLVLIGLGALIWYESTRPHVSGPAMVADGIVYDSIFGDLKLTQPGWQLRDVRASTIIGDIKIDLSKATIPDGETIVDVRAIIGDVDIWAPPDLPVALDAQCTFVTVNYFGAKNDVILRRTVETPPAYEVAPRRVRVRAEMVFGDLNLIRARQAA